MPPPVFLDIDPRTLHLPPSSRHGADPAKLQRQGGPDGKPSGSRSDRRREIGARPSGNDLSDPGPRAASPPGRASRPGHPAESDAQVSRISAGDPRLTADRGDDAQAGDPNPQADEAGGFRDGRSDGRGHGDRPEVRRAASLTLLTRADERRGRRAAQCAIQRKSVQIAAEALVTRIEARCRGHDDPRRVDREGQVDRAAGVTGGLRVWNGISITTCRAIRTTQA